MLLTNKYGLPEPIVRAIQNDPYSSGVADITTTSLVAPPQLFVLKKRYAAELTEDVSDGIWRLVGQSIHSILERAAPQGTITEQRYYQRVNGWMLGGAIDLYDKDTLVDYKVTSVYSYLRGAKEEWIAQGNVNRWLLHKNGIDVKYLKNILLLRDWAEWELERKKGYPPVQVQTLDLPMWTLEETERFITERIKIFQNAMKLPDNQLPKCSAEERWFNSKGVPKRCERYCLVKTKCHQYKNPEMADWVEAV